MQGRQMCRLSETGGMFKCETAKQELTPSCMGRLQGYGIEVGSLEQKKEAGESVLESLDARLAKTKEKIAEANTRLGELLGLRRKKKTELEAFVMANPDSYAEIAKRQAECKEVSKEINEIHRLLAKLKAQKQQNRAKARTAKKNFGK